jgi:GWxTD domain-containing protein
MSAHLLPAIRKVLYIVIVIGIFPGSVISETIFRLNADCAIFFDHENNPYVEVYYAFDKSALVHVEGPGEVKQGEAVVTVRIAKGETIIVNDAWRMQFKADDPSSSARVVDMVRYGIDPGQYRLSVYATDLNDRAKKDSVVVEFEADQYNKNNLVLSDVELASNIAQSTSSEKSNFFKNTLDVIPNPGALYGEGRPVLFFYLEAYNLLDAIKGEKYSMRCWVTNWEGSEVEECPPITRIKNRRMETSVEIGTINISKLRSGGYVLNLGIAEVEGELLASRTKKFFVHNASELAAENIARAEEARREIPNEFASMTAEQLEWEYETMQYLLNDEGKKLYKSLENVAARRSFIHAVWKSRDTNPQTPINEFRQAYLERKDYADEKYRRMGKEGWKTDRGRVYMIYGKPDEIDWFPSSPETYPHEIWIYESIEGGVEFVFVDSSGFNEYVLVHSTASAELRDDNWRQRRAQILR